MKQLALVLSTALTLIGFSACSNNPTAPTPPSPANYNPGYPNPNPITDAVVPSGWKRLKDSSGNDMIITANLVSTPIPPNSIVIGMGDDIPMYDCDKRPVCIEFVLEVCSDPSSVYQPGYIWFYLSENIGEFKWTYTGRNPAPTGCERFDFTVATTRAVSPFPLGQPRYIEIKSSQHRRDSPEVIEGSASFATGWFNPCTDPELAKVSGCRV